jgi:hypothetical protein
MKININKRDVRTSCECRLGNLEDSMKERCQREVLVESALAKIELCSCGMIHVSAGPLTLRLEPHAFEALSETIGFARERLQRRKLPCKSMAPS